MEKVRFFKSLHFKIASGVIATVLLSSAVYFFSDYRSSRGRLLDELRQSADQLATISLQGLLELAMLGRHPQLLQQAIERLAANSSVEQILIMDLEGVVRFSSDTSDLGRKLEKQGEGCADCHSLGSDKLAGSEFVAIGDQEFLRDVRLVPNQPQCHACHDPQEPHNGLLIIDFPTAEIWAQLRSDFYQTLLRVGLSVLMILVVLGLLLNQLVIRPLRKLHAATTGIEGDNPSQSHLEAGTDELGRLAHSFADMRDRVHSTFQKLQGQRAYLQHLINSLNDGLIVLDGEMQIEMTNRAADQIGPREILQNLLQAPELRKALSRTLETGQAGSCELQQHDEDSKDGRFVEIYCSPFRTAQSDVGQVILLVRDITSRRQLQAQASRAERLAAVGQLAAGLAHEINNPLAAITTCAEGLSRHLARSTGIEAQEKEEIQDYLATVAEAAMRCKNITQRLMGASVDQTSTEFEEVELRPIIKTALDLVEHQARMQEIEIVFAESKRSPTILGNREKLSQLILNLLLNSLEATSPGGRINVSLGESPEFVELAVSDTGTGIPEQLLEKIFDPFFTTKAQTQGTGLGLSICQWIVRQHGGRLDVQSQVGAGATFSIQLPRTKEVSS